MVPLRFVSFRFVDYNKPCVVREFVNTDYTCFSHNAGSREIVDVENRPAHLVVLDEVRLD